MDHARRTALMHQALEAAITYDGPATAAALAEVGEHSTPRELFGVCGGLAAGGIAALKMVHGDDYNPAVHLLWFREAVPGANEADPHGAWAMRFLVAHANGDMPMANALFRTAMDAGGDDLARSITSLLAVAADLARAAIEHVHARQA